MASFGTRAYTRRPRFRWRSSRAPSTKPSALEVRLGCSRSTRRFTVPLPTLLFRGSLPEPGCPRERTQARKSFRPNPCRLASTTATPRRASPRTRLRPRTTRPLPHRHLPRLPQAAHPLRRRRLPLPRLPATNRRVCPNHRRLHLRAQRRRRRLPVQHLHQRPSLRTRHPARTRTAQRRTQPKPILPSPTPRSLTRPSQRTARTRPPPTAALAKPTGLVCAAESPPNRLPTKISPATASSAPVRVTRRRLQAR